MAAWRADVDRVGIEQAIMIARDNVTRARLNHEARVWRESRSELGERIELGKFEVAVGDRVIARRNDREATSTTAPAAPCEPSTSKGSG